ncbi:glutathione S-transferase [Melanogaster broomeanus]|nr:glutathione S-transferase [Melanogaster broomeanus]
MVVKLYGFPVSTCTRLVALICKEKEIPYELVPVDLMEDEHKSPAFMQHQPFGQIPYIDDDGFILYESRAICRYLIEKYPTQGTLGLIPTDPQAEALFEQAASIEITNFDALAGSLMEEKVFKPFRDLQTDEARAAEYLAALNAKMDVYEGHPWKAEIPRWRGFCAPLATRMSSRARPNVARWWNELTNRPAWNAVKSGA